MELKTLTVRIPKSMDRRIEKIARDGKLSKADAIRALLARGLGVETPEIVRGLAGVGKKKRKEIASKGAKKRWGE